jgi:hypothetical protein
MITYFLNRNADIIRSVAFEDGSIQQVAVLSDDAAYLEWVEAGGVPEPAPIPVAPVELTTEQKLEAAGLTVAELKTLFGLS